MVPAISQTRHIDVKWHSTTRHQNSKQPHACRPSHCGFELLCDPLGCSRSIRWSDPLLKISVIYSFLTFAGLWQTIILLNLAINLTLPVPDRDDMD
ncbi:hypothetical protein V1522DRAFT_127084 [Lipomyces starkeyi]